MVESQRNRWCFPYLDNTIYQPSKIKLVLPDLWPQKVQNWLRKSSGIGSTSVSEREIETAHITNETEKAELEVKQEFMARVITDLEMKNTELETKECYGLFYRPGGFSKFDRRAE